MKYKKYIGQSIFLTITLFVGIENYVFSSQDKETYTSQQGTSGGTCTVTKGSSTNSGTTNTTTHGTSGGTSTVTK